MEEGGSNSLLVLGPRGVGKSLLVTHALLRVESYSPTTFFKDVIVVRLNGLVETDDKLALRSITRQMSVTSSETATDGETTSQRGFAQQLEHLLASLRSGDGRSSKPVVFLLEEFDLFCNHHNQTLLYNLFDVAQSKAAPICVIGVSANLDVVESLEKRVKSRFNHRQVAMLPLQSFDRFYSEVVQPLLTLPDDDDDDRDGHRRYEKGHNRRAWNDWVISDFLADREVRQAFRRAFAFNNTVGHLKQLLYVALVTLEDGDDAEGCLTAAHLLKVQEDHLGFGSVPEERNLLTGLSILEMCLLIAIKHVMTFYEGTSNVSSSTTPSFNFEMAYHEYDKFATRRARMFRYERPVVMKAWEALQELELITPLDSGCSKAQQKEYRLHTLQVSTDLILSVVDAGLPLPVKEWANHSINE